MMILFDLPRLCAEAASPAKSSPKLEPHDVAKSEVSESSYQSSSIYSDAEVRRRCKV